MNVLYGREHYSKIAKQGWTGESRQKRLAVHQSSIARAREVLKQKRAAQKKHGSEWMFEGFRERILTTSDPRAELHALLVSAESNHDPGFLRPDRSR